MKEVNAIEAVAALQPRDLIEVIADVNAPRDATLDVRPKSSFEIAWDLGH
jgi:hypothetical protein